MGILANNEWKEGFPRRGLHQLPDHLVRRDSAAPGAIPTRPLRSTEREILQLRSRRMVAADQLSVSEEYRDFLTYNAMIYSRGELFYHQLREIVGEETMREDPPDLLRPVEAQARERGAVQGGGGGGVGAGSRPPSSPSGCIRRRCTTTRSGGLRCGGRGAERGTVGDPGGGETAGAGDVSRGRRGPDRTSTRVVPNRRAGGAGWVR